MSLSWLRKSCPVLYIFMAEDFVSQMREMDIRLSDIGISRSKESILDVYDKMYIVEALE